MKRIQSDHVTLLDLEPHPESFLSAVTSGLARTPRTLPCKFLYDARGSQLFDRICELDEYYPTRTELAIMEAHVDEMIACFEGSWRLIELGSGSSTKTRLLLDHARRLVRYLPIDISRDHLLSTAEELAQAYPEIVVEPVCADYTLPVDGVDPAADGTQTVIYFPGSTLGNFCRAEAVPFLQRLAALAAPRGGLLIGIDLVKDITTLHRAYNDSEGVTAAFNLNLLSRINRELGGDFDLAAFRHRAFWDEEPQRIELQLVSRRRQTVHIDGHAFRFAEGEPIVTEYSHKFRQRDFAALVAEAGFEVAKTWTDPEQLFSVQWCTLST